MFRDFRYLFSEKVARGLYPRYSRLPLHMPFFRLRLYGTLYTTSKYHFFNTNLRIDDE